MSVVERAGQVVALPAVEIVPDGGIYDYAARYTAGTTEFFVPARLTDAVSAAVADAAERAHVALGLRDLSRADLVVDSAGVPWLLEVNVAPGHDRDVAAAAVGRGRRARPRARCVSSWLVGAVNRGAKTG